MNCAVLEQDGMLLIIDCGMTFPDEETLGVELVMPDLDWLVENETRIAGLVITHGHFDHIGAVPYLLEQIDLPIYAPPLAAEMIRATLQERDLDDGVVIHKFEAGSRFKVGPFEIEAIHVNHSIPQTCALAIRTSSGLFVHTADFKLDANPLNEPPADLKRLRELGKEGVQVLFSDSTNVERSGSSGSERDAREGLRAAISEARQAVFVALFSTNLFRVQSLCDIAAETGRVVVLLGRSMEKLVGIARELGLLRLPHEGIIASIESARDLPRHQLLLLCSGSQGETRATMNKLATGEMRSFEVTPNDLVIFSSRVIPGNEKGVSRIRNMLARRGARFLEDERSVHVSGHAYRDEQQLMIECLRPKIFVPVHGEHRFLKRHAELARALGVKEAHVLDNGDVLEIAPKGAKVIGRRHAVGIAIDGTALGPVDGQAMRERRRLARRGVMTVFVAVDLRRGELLDGPHLSAMGVAEEVEEILKLAEEAAATAFGKLDRESRRSQPAIAEAIRRAVMGALRRELERKPLIEVMVYDAGRIVR